MIKAIAIAQSAGGTIAPQPSPTTYPSAVALKGAEWPVRDSLEALEARML